jgi:hypothetical protein
MIDGSATSTTAHPTVSFVLDIADEVIKFCAVVIGGLWTWWNYHKSRTYEQRLELEVVGTVFTKRDLYGDIKATVKNIGATKHRVQQAGTYCEISIVLDDLTEQSVLLFPVFTLNDKIEPGESINDTRCWRVPQPIDNIVWVKLNLRVVSDGVEWNTGCNIRVESLDQVTAPKNEAI